MKVTKFYSLRGSIGDYNFHRKIGKNATPGIYFWGFNLRDDNQYPQSINDILIWYVGIDKNVSQRIMQEVTQSIFGGFGTIIDHNYLKSNPHNARLMDLQESDNKRNNPVHPAVLYKSDGLHLLYHFFDDKKIKETLEWMRERLIFTWIEEKNDQIRKTIEKEMHDIVGTNIFGIGDVKKLNIKNIIEPNDTIYFNEIDWADNQILKDWLFEVNKNVNGVK